MSIMAKVAVLLLAFYACIILATLLILLLSLLIGCDLNFLDGMYGRTVFCGTCNVSSHRILWKATGHKASKYGMFLFGTVATMSLQNDYKVNSY